MTANINFDTEWMLGNSQKVAPNILGRPDQFISETSSAPPPQAYSLVDMYARDNVSLRTRGFEPTFQDGFNKEGLHTNYNVSMGHNHLQEIGAGLVQDLTKQAPGHAAGAPNYVLDDNGDPSPWDHINRDALASLEHNDVFYRQGQDKHRLEASLAAASIPELGGGRMPSAMEEHVAEWFYIDPSGTEQGPFDALQMHEWYKAGYFGLTLLVRHKLDQHPEPLIDIIQRVGDKEKPFLVAQVNAKRYPPANYGRNPGFSMTGTPPSSFYPPSQHWAEGWRQQHVPLPERLPGQPLYQSSQPPLMVQPPLYPQQPRDQPPLMYQGMPQISGPSDPYLYSGIMGGQGGGLVSVAPPRAPTGSWGMPTSPDPVLPIDLSTTHVNSVPTIPFPVSRSHVEDITQALSNTTLDDTAASAVADTRLTSEKMLETYDPPDALQDFKLESFPPVHDFEQDAVAAVTAENTKPADEPLSQKDLSVLFTSSLGQKAQDASPETDPWGPEPTVPAGLVSKEDPEKDTPFGTSTASPWGHKPVPKKTIREIQEEEEREAAKVAMAQKAAKTQQEKSTERPPQTSTATSTVVSSAWSAVASKGVVSTPSQSNSSWALPKKESLGSSTISNGVGSTTNALGSNAATNTTAANSTYPPRSSAGHHGNGRVQPNVGIQDYVSRRTTASSSGEPSADFKQWCKETLCDLNPNANRDEVLQMLLSLPLDTSSVEIIQDIIYANSATMDARAFTTNFMKHRRADKAGQFDLDTASPAKETPFQVVTKKGKKKPSVPSHHQ